MGSAGDDPCHARASVWNDGFSYRELAGIEVKGPGQITNAWLAELARRNAAKIATLDVGLVALHGEVGFLIPGWVVTESFETRRRRANASGLALSFVGIPQLMVIMATSSEYRGPLRAIRW